MRDHDDLGMDRWRHHRFSFNPSPFILHVDPLSVFDAEIGSRFRIDLDELVVINYLK